MIADNIPLFPELAHHVRSVASLAAERIMEIYTSDFAIDQKDDSSPLTAADMAAHETICKNLVQHTPDIPILSEESAEISFSERKNWNRYWLVDPLDGTREFIKRNGEFTVNIALVEHNYPVLGVVHVPVTGITYFAVKGHGAYKQLPEESARSIQVKTTSQENITIAGSRSHGNKLQKTFIGNVENNKVIAIGSSLKFCLVAEGLVDIYPRFGPTSEWDTAAAQCIVEEAGGQVLDTSFNRLKYNTKDSLINPDFLAIADDTFNWKKYLP